MALIDLYEEKYSRMDQVKFVEDSLYKIWNDMVCWGILVGQQTVSLQIF